MGTHNLNLAAIIKKPSNDEEFLLIKQNPPPKFNDPEYDSYQDSDLWDLPFTQLTPLRSPLSQQNSFEAEDSTLLENLRFLNQFDVNLALNQVLSEVGFGTVSEVKWKLLKYVEEPEFGPGIPVNTVFLIGKLGILDGKLKDPCKWLSIKGCIDMLTEVKPDNDRIGPLVVDGFLNDRMQSANLQIPPSLRCQEYPPGVKLIPMASRTTKPFHMTNLAVFFPRTIYSGFNGDSFVTSGDALIVDPGCKSNLHKELEEIIAALPRKLIVFVTHHHQDHVDGLSVVQKCKPDAVLLAHESTMHRIGKDDWSLDYVPVSGNEEICIGGQRLRVIPALGHTDGHMSLLHISTHSLIVGDHCVGQGSALLDITSGGNMGDYFHTTYKFIELSPHVLIPMHGRVNMWPKHMLCGYLKNRRNRESTILKAIEGGAKTLFDIVAYTYAEVDHNLWIPSSSNVRLHVDHLAQQDKLPKEFSLERFQSTRKLHFLSRWVWAYLCNAFSAKNLHLPSGKFLAAGAVAAIALFYCICDTFSLKKHV